MRVKNELFLVCLRRADKKEKLESLLSVVVPQ